MKKILKILAILIAVVIVLVAGLLGYVRFVLPNADPAPVITVERTPERIERGKYLAHFVVSCIDCHSTRDFSKFAGPIVPGTEGKGGEKFTEDAGGVPGVIYSRNITPSGIPEYSDGELLRAFTTGVTRTNRALFPLMPYMAYSHLTQEDAYSIVAYIRSLQPIENQVPETALNFPMNFIVNTIPLKSYTPAPEPDRTNSLEYGRYLATVGACADCHTPAVKGDKVPGMDFAGGFEFVFPGGVVRSLNITPDPETGIGSWTKEDFLARFKAFLSPETYSVTMGPNDFNTPMPWAMYAHLKDEDLSAIYDYLRIVKPVKHSVEKFTANPAGPAGWDSTLSD